MLFLLLLLFLLKSSFLLNVNRCSNKDKKHSRGTHSVLLSRKQWQLNCMPSNNNINNNNNKNNNKHINTTVTEHTFFTKTIIFLFTSAIRANVTVLYWLQEECVFFFFFLLLNSLSMSIIIYTHRYILVKNSLHKAWQHEAIINACLFKCHAIFVINPLL